jgi:TBC1 domain family member 4
LTFFLALFSSQFQIGFVARVFDFLFAEGLSILFKISLAILQTHKPLLISCESFESIVNHIKTTIPEMSLIESEMIINKSLNYNFDRSLKTYELEFDIFNEEIQTISCMKPINDSSQMESACVRASLGNQEVNKELMSANKNLELENAKLKKHLSQLTERNQLLELKLRNQEHNYSKHLHENNQLKCKVDTFEFERKVLIDKLKEQERLIKSLNK